MKVYGHPLATEPVKPEATGSRRRPDTGAAGVLVCSVQSVQNNKYRFIPENLRMCESCINTHTHTHTHTHTQEPRASR